MSEEARAVLLVSPYTSECGRCGKGAHPKDSHHMEPTGCGARFVAIAAKWSTVTEDMLRRLRPDLPISPTGEPPHPTSKKG